MTEEEEEALREFTKDMVENQKQIPSEFQQIINEHFWELVD